jgi:uncharacterized iron-regulated membrane protein
MLPRNSHFSARRTLLWLHLTGGLTLAVYAVVLGVSGSLLVFRDELTALAYPEFHRRDAPPLAGSPDVALAAARAAFPGWQAYSVTWPHAGSPYWMVYLLRGAEAREVFVHGSAVAGSRDPGGGFLGGLMRLHVNFHAGRTGRWINGLGAMALLGMCVTGLLLWWPPARSRFRVDWRSGWRRLSWQLHHVTGIAALAFIAVLAFTGGYYVWSAAYIAAVDRFFERSIPPAAAASDGPLADLEELAARARAAVPGRPVFRMSIPSPRQPVTVTLLEGAPAEFHKVSTVALDPVSADVLQAGRYEERPAGNSILAWFSVLHFGRFGGLPGKVLWAVLGLSLPVLAVTGCLMWWRRVIEPKLRKEEAAASTVAA